MVPPPIWEPRLNHMLLFPTWTALGRYDSSTFWSRLVDGSIFHEEKRRISWQERSFDICTPQSPFSCRAEWKNEVLCFLTSGGTICSYLTKIWTLPSYYDQPGLWCSIFYIGVLPLAQQQAYQVLLRMLGVQAEPQIHLSHQQVVLQACHHFQRSYLRSLAQVMLDQEKRTRHVSSLTSSLWRSLVPVLSTSPIVPAAF